MGVISPACRAAQKTYMDTLTPENHPRWKGDKVGYRALHMWIVKNFGKATTCDNLNCEFPNYHRFEWANLTNKTSRERSNWARLCVYCHRRMDKKSIKPKLK